MATVGDHARRQAAKLPSLSLDPPPMQATQEQLQQHKIPLQYRDYCAHLLIPLNEVRLQRLKSLSCFLIFISFGLFLRHCVVYSILFFLFFLCGTPYWCSSPLSVFSFQFWVLGSVCEVMGHWGDVIYGRQASKGCFDSSLERGCGSLRR